MLRCRTCTVQGQDYDRTLSLPSIDYGTAHVYEGQRGNW